MTKRSETRRPFSVSGSLEEERVLLKGQEQRTTTTAEFQQNSAQLLQTAYIEDTVLGYGRSFLGMGGTKARFGVVQDRMESFPCKEGAC
ncbi:MAG: hypothetical protein KAJ36_08015 [Candidatus Thorarchaeota archaeon]|nr:hypothetical protein [Candidatus Thorarchaeota archaeon]